MEENGATQVLEPVETQLSPQGAGAPPPPAATATGGIRGGFPKRWIVLIAVAVVLLAAGIGVLLLSGDKPDETTSADLAVPDLRGMTLDRAGEEVLAAGLVPGTVQYAVVEESVTPSGTVLSQEPLPGALVAPGTALNIVLARGVASAAQIETPDTPTDTATSDSSSSSGSSGSGTPPPETQPVLPDLPPMETIDPGLLQPRVLNPGIWNLLEPEWTTRLYHSEGGGDWQSPAIAFGGKPKRIFITADGPLQYPIAVWSWGPGDSDWRLENISIAAPGAYEDLEHGGMFEYDFLVGEGSYAILVRAHPEIVWWSVKIEEQK